MRTLDTYLATALLHAVPTAKAFERVGPTRISKIVYDGRHRVGKELATLRANGKPAKVALVACMRKLLIALYAVARDRKPFVPHVPAEAKT